MGLENPSLDPTPGPGLFLEINFFLFNLILFGGARPGGTQESLPAVLSAHTMGRRGPNSDQLSAVQVTSPLASQIKFY